MRIDWWSIWEIRRPERAGPFHIHCFLHNLQTPNVSPWHFNSLVTATETVFSPHGRVLLHATLGGDGRTHLWLVDARTLEEMPAISFMATTLPGPPKKKLGISAWGSSSDVQDGTFMYAFLQGEDVNVNLFNTSRKVRVMSNFMAGNTAQFGFSPCGDLFGLTRLPVLERPQVWLMETLDGNSRVGGAQLEPPFHGLFADSEHHYASSGGSQVELTDNTAGQACPDVGTEPPYWPEGSALSATQIEATSLLLRWDAARSVDSPIVQYELSQVAPDSKSLGLIAADDAREWTVKNLAPGTEYQFSLRAQNLAELWTTENLSLTVSTADADTAPTWPVNADLTASHQADTRLELAWDAAVDDQAVTAYRVFQDGDPIQTLPGTQLTTWIEGLETGARYTFKIQAGDGDDQWSTDGPSLRVATVDTLAPTWPVGSRLFASDSTPTALRLEWTEAVDNVEVTEYRLYFRAQGEWRLVGSVWGAFRVNCLRPGTSYTFKIEAGDEAGNWSDDGPMARLSTAAGDADCLRFLEVASRNSREELARGEWVPVEPAWGRYNAARSRDPDISAEGRFVVFASMAVNLVPGDANSHRVRYYNDANFTETWYDDIFLRDRETGTTERISVSSGGWEASTGFSSADPAVSADGRFVVFSSRAPNLVSGDNNGTGDIFLRDRKFRTTRRIPSLGSGQDPNGISHSPCLNAEGTLVAFVSSASNLVGTDDNGVADIYVHDTVANRTRRVSISSEGMAADGASWGPSLSADGRFVAFASKAGNLVPGDTNQAADVFVHDRETGITTRVSVSSSGEESNDSSASGRPNHPPDSSVALSADGRFVIFDSYATNLVPNDTNGKRDVFVHDREAGETSRVNVSSDGGQTSGWDEFPPESWMGSSWDPAISGGGRWVVFASNAPNLVPGDYNSWTDIFRHDRETGVTERINVCRCGDDVTETAEWSGAPAISLDGRFTVFASHAMNLLPGLADLNDSEDIFVHDQRAGLPDQDGDGIPDIVESGPAGEDPDYDGNEDGVPDWSQDWVVSTHTWENGGYLTGINPGEIHSLRMEPVVLPAGLPSGVELPFGCLRLTLREAVEPEGALQLHFYYPDGVSFNSYYKFGPTPESPAPDWYEFMFDGRTGAEIDGSHVILHFVDGERGDDDLLANGAIVDPGSPARVEGPTAPQLEVGETEVRLDARTTRVSISLINIGGRTLTWGLQEDLPSWLQVEPRGGVLPMGSQGQLEILANEAELPAGDYAHEITLFSGGGTERIAVYHAVPLMLQLEASWQPGCLVLKWFTRANTAYRVQSTPHLDEGWADVSGSILGEGGWFTWADCPMESANPTFYRIIAEE